MELFVLFITTDYLRQGYRPREEVFLGEPNMHLQNVSPGSKKRTVWLEKDCHNTTNWNFTKHAFEVCQYHYVVVSTKNARTAFQAKILKLEL